MVACLSLPGSWFTRPATSAPRKPDPSFLFVPCARLKDWGIGDVLENLDAILLFVLKEDGGGGSWSRQG